MRTPLQDMPDLRATFEADTQALIRLAGQQLAALTQPDPDYAVTAALRDTVHALRGAAAMVGALALTSLIEDYQRLLEVADSFKLSARDKAREVYAFLECQLEHLRAAVQATLAGRADEAKRCQEIMHRDVTATWGAYFYSPTTETSEEPVSEEPVARAAAKPARPVSKLGHSRHGDANAIARDFLTSLGVAAPTPPALTAARPVAEPAPAPVPEPAPNVPQALAEQIDPEMLSYFVLETGESLTQLEGLLLSWEKTPDDAKIAQSVFRLTHTVKGAANSLGLTRIGKLLHGLEDLLETHVVDRVYPNLTQLVEVIFSVADTVKALVRETQTGIADPTTGPRLADLSQRIQALASAPPPPLRTESADEVQVPLPAPPLGSVPDQGLESSATAQPAPQSAGTLAPSSPPPAPTDATPSAPEAPKEIRDRSETFDHQTIRVDSDRLDLLMNLIGELVISRSRLEKKLSDISRLKEEMFFGRSRLFQAITDFQGKYEYSNPAAERSRPAPGEEAVPQPVLPSGGRRHAPVEPGTLTDFSELEFDQYDDFNILARTLMEIGTDTGEIFSQLTRFFDAFSEETGQFSKITARLQDEITRVRMMPLTLLFKRLQRAARDAARKEQKNIEFSTDDNDTRLDKLILDQLYTPLLHIVRNAVSHGIEGQERRVGAGKPAAGQIRLRAACEANHVVIEVSDDGGGLDLAAIRATAIKRGLLAPDAVVDDETLIQCIFQPGFSTAASVTDVSGRGVGLDVVRQEIARLSGSVHVRSTPGKGCHFIIHLPLTLAINQAMFITAGTETCALPINFVEHIQEGHAAGVTMSGQQELVTTPEGMVPFLRMHRLLNVPENQGNGTIVLARVADRRVAIGVDRILRKQDIVVKPLGPLLREHPLFSGATLGGDGQVVMIVDLPRLLENEQFAVSQAIGAAGGQRSTVEVNGPARPTILVVDDSLSVRKVLEKHLLSLHFKVELAVDGLDALERLRTRPFSLVLTDLEMPRMHGFELIAEMRRQEALREVPIIVVTSRDAEKHRRRATSLGANDYIIKPFSREQLAEYINRHLNKRTR